MKKWSLSTWDAIAPIYHKILEHPFITELKAGKLPEEKFSFYIQQDALYLYEFGKVLAAIAARLTKPEYIQAYLEFSTGTIMVERALHETFLKTFQANKTLEKSPACLLYTNYLHTQFTTQPLEVAMGAVLPCFWIYKEVGDHILATQDPTENKYQEWIDTYGGEAFAKSVATAIEITDDVAEQTTEAVRNRMTQAFTMASKMEWLFWDSAYQLEEWKI